MTLAYMAGRRSDDMDELRAENERLRAALGRIRPIPERIIQSAPVRDLTEVLAEADAALAQSDGEDQ